MQRTHRNVGEYRIPQIKAAPLDPEANPWWWNPGRVGVPSGPAWFTRQLEELDPGLAITRNNFSNRFQIWCKAPRLRQKVCTGWKLLFAVDELSEHVFGSLYQLSMNRLGTAKQHFDAIEREIARDKDRAEKRAMSERLAEAMPRYDHMQISVGYGQSNGSKFSDYLS